MKTNHYKQKSIKGFTAMASLLSCLTSFAQNTSPWPSMGSVGIGTISPTHTLHVVGRTRHDVNTSGAGNGRHFFTRPSLLSYENLLSFGSNGTGSYEWLLGTTVSSNDFSIVSSNGVARLNVKQDGRIGINTPIPATGALLEIKDNSAKSFIFYGNGVGDLQSTTAFRPHFATSTDFTIFEGVAASATAKQRLSIINGNVEIGEATPNAKLQIDVPTNNTNALLVNSNGFSLFDYNSNGGLIIGKNYLSSAPDWAKVPAFRITPCYDAGGNPVATKVGIGVENPVANLEISSVTGYKASVVLGSRTSDLSAIYWAGNWGTGGVGFGMDKKGPDNNVGGIFVNYNPNSTTPAERIMSFLKTGSGPQVWIGDKKPTIAPYTNARLSIDGTLVAQEIYVCDQAGGGWADYVFNKEYKLMSLADVEKYVNANKHLPNVPSAKEIEEKGQSLGKLQIIQMEKIEELTLYIIELKKEIEILKTKIVE